MQVYKNILLMGGVGYDSNIYLIDRKILIDTGTGIFFPQIRDNMINMGIKPKNIKMIINTHRHFDHTGGDKKFRDWTKAKICIHEAEKESLEKAKDTLAEYFGLTARSITIDKTLYEGDVIKTKNFLFEVIHTPGHSPGSICLYEREKHVLISGDLIFSDAVGKTNLPGGDIRLLKESLIKISKLSIGYLLPGHGMPKIGGISLHIKQMLTQIVGLIF